MGQSEFDRYCDQLLDHGHFESVATIDLVLDRVCINVLSRASAVSALRGSPLQFDSTDHGLAILDSIQNPMMVYRPKGSEKLSVISGLFTYHRLMQQRTTSTPVISVPVFLLDKAPKPDQRELLVLHELTRSLLRQCFINSSSLIADYLYAWFDCGPEQRLFEMDKWRALFPQLTTKAELCRWLEISSKTFIPTTRSSGP